MKSHVSKLMFLLGLIVGYFLAWLFIRSSRARLQAQLAQLQADVAAHDRELAEYRNRISSLQSRYDTQIQALDQTVRPAADVTHEAGQVPDDLTKIRGIGPVYAARLSAAGLRRYADLAAAEPEELARAAGVRKNVDTRLWIAQAKTLAGGPQQTGAGDAP